MSSVKELMETSRFLTCIPSNYSFPPDSHHIVAVSDAQSSIPTIDFSFLTSENADQRSTVINQLGYACREFGFFSVINHNLPQKLMEDMLKVCEGFFDLREEEKGEYRGKNVFDRINYGTSFNTRNDKSLFWRDHLKVYVHPHFNAPSKPENFREISKEFCTRAREVAKQLLRGIIVSLGMDEDYLEKTMDVDIGSQLLVVNLYPPCPQPEATIGLPPHSDHGMLTFLIHNQLPGLQILHRSEWLPVNPNPGSLIFNIGDHMEILSNGIYKSVIHRALVNDKSTRMSIGIANGPPLEKIVSPAIELVDKDTRPLAYKGITYRDYIQLQYSHQLNSKSCLDLIRI